MSSDDWKQLSVLVNRLRSLNPLAASGRAQIEPARRDRTSLLAALSAQIPDLTVDVEVLSDLQLQRAAYTLVSADAGPLRQLLTEAGSDTERGYLLKAFAAGHSLEASASFAGQIRGQDRAWLHEHLSLGLARASADDETDVVQSDETTCGSASIVVIHALADPLYALRLSTGAGTFEHRLAEELQRVHEATTNGQLRGIPATRWNRASQWPQGLGTPPWGMTSYLNSLSGITGTKYRSRLIDDYAGGNAGQVLSSVERAVDAGTPVPIYTGDGVPRHVLVVLGHRDETLLIYEPSSGRLVPVAEHDFTDGTMQGAGGWPHVSFVLTPDA
jgi:hypothetical protein